MQFKKTSIIALSSTLLLSGVLPSVSHAAKMDNVQTPNITALNDASEQAYNVDESLFERTPTIDEMTEEQKTLFKQLVHEEAIRSDSENPELYEEVLTSFFTQDSYNTFNLPASETKLKRAKRAAGLRIGADFAASAINVALGIAVGGGVGAIQAYIISKGKKEAQRLFTKTVTSKLKAWGANKLAWAIGGAVGFAMDYGNIGSAVTKYLDRKDSKPNNGWIDF